MLPTAFNSVPSARLVAISKLEHSTAPSTPNSDSRRGSISTNYLSSIPAREILLTEVFCVCILRVTEYAPGHSSKTSNTLFSRLIQAFRSRVSSIRIKRTASRKGSLSRSSLFPVSSELGLTVENCVLERFLYSRTLIPEPDPIRNCCSLQLRPSTLSS